MPLITFSYYAHTLTDATETIWGSEHFFMQTGRTGKQNTHLLFVTNSISTSSPLFGHEYNTCVNLLGCF